jgi:hypothetical protein
MEATGDYWEGPFCRLEAEGFECVLPEFRIIREHTRYRRDLTAERTREKQRAEKLLESAAIKLSSVITDLHGITGRDIMDHLIAGESWDKLRGVAAARPAEVLFSAQEPRARYRGPVRADLPER